MNAYDLINFVFSRTPRVYFIKKYMTGLCLDIGCEGSVLHALIDNEKVVGIDFQVIKYSRGDRVIRGDALHSPFRESVFDTIIAGEVIEHFYHPINFIEESARVLKSGGSLIITTPNKNSWFNKITGNLNSPNHVSLMDRQQLFELVKDFFDVSVFCGLTPDRSWLESDGSSHKLDSFTNRAYGKTKMIVFLNCPIIKQFTSLLLKYDLDFFGRRLIQFLIPISFQEGFFMVLKKKNRGD